MNNKKNGLISLIILFIVLILATIYFASNNATRMGESFLDDSKNESSQDRKNNDTIEVSEDDGDKNKKAQKRIDNLKLFLEEPYYRLPVIFVPAIKTNKLKGILNIRVVMKIDQRKAFNIAKNLVPRITDAIFVDLFKAFNLLWYPKYDPNPKIIKKRILKTIQEVLGKGGIDTIIIQEFFFTRFSR
ncbi:MAG: hypothetical protein C0432_02195 [Candidatus Puniceispirillum sp.]|nr:hypothetical protein [Candidatus Pelagibacter sp.]MBA4283086.1 hypothetical protein [Candidatus Puniceispirillum sp.]